MEEVIDQAKQLLILRKESSKLLDLTQLETSWEYQLCLHHKFVKTLALVLNVSL